MGTESPVELTRLLDAANETERQEVWETFVQTHSRLIMHAARLLGGGYDAVMDRYAHVLDRLRADDFKRLRAYTPVPSTKFTTWLVVVSRRLCADLHRSRYGRTRGTVNPGSSNPDKLILRKRLADLLSADIDPNALSDNSRVDPERQVLQDEISSALDEALTQLPSSDRLLLALRYEDDAPTREIADLMAFPSQFHVYRHLKKVLVALKRILEAQGVDGAGSGSD